MPGEVTGPGHHPPGEVADVGLVAGAPAAIAGGDRVVQQRFRAQVRKADALGRQRRRHVEAGAPLEMPGGFLPVHQCEKLIQVRVVLRGLKMLVG